MKIMDERVTIHKEVPVGEVNRAYQPYSDSKLRAWILDTYVWVIPQHREMVDYFTEVSDLEILKDILKALLPDMSTKKKFVLSKSHLVEE